MEPSICSGRVQGSQMAHLLRPPTAHPPRCWKVKSVSRGGGRRDQSVHPPPPEATSPLKRGKGPGLLSTPETNDLWLLVVAVPPGGRSRRISTLQASSPGARGGAHSHPPHLGRAVGVAIPRAGQPVALGPGGDPPSPPGLSLAREESRV